MADTPAGPLVPDRLRATAPKLRFWLAVVSGALAAFGQAPFSLQVIAVLGLAGGFVLGASADSLRRALWLGWAFGTGYFAVALNWIVEPFLVDIARHGWMAPFALILLSGGLALFWGAAFGLAHRLGPTPARFALAWVLALSLAELARGYVLTGFPWALIGHIWIDSAAVQLAAFIGPNGLTLLTLALVAGVATLLMQTRRTAWVLAAPLPFLALGALGQSMVPLAQDDARGPIVRLIQPNAPQDQKWDPEHVQTFYRRQLAFTGEAASTPPDLIVWPESAIPWRLNQASEALAQMAKAANGAPVIVGLQRRDGLLAFNALAVIDSDGTATHVYDKHHLVPFGEYIPFGDFAKRFGIRSFAAQDGFGFTPGPGPQVLDLGPLGTALPLICYEAIFPQNITGAAARPDYLLHLTNDAWFGEVSGPYQHLAQARLRAVEQGLPMVRVANTGISAVIDPWGRITASIPLGEAGWIDQALPAARAPTLYSRTGDLPVTALIALGLLVLLTLAMRNRH